MKCERCGKNEANVQYTQIINGMKEELSLCEKCANDLGWGDISFSMPIDFSNFFGEFLEGDNINTFPDMKFDTQNTCKKCGMTFEEFANTGKFGCDNCYGIFTNKIDRILKGVHGTDSHVGRKYLEQKKSINNNVEIEQDTNITKIEELKNKLKALIKEENYEEAAKIRDEIKKLEGGK